MVYFIRAMKFGPIKIGFTADDPGKRMATLKTGHYRELKLIGIMEGGRELETKLHDRFRDIHLKGEWFKPTRKLIRFIERNTMIDELDLEELMLPVARRFDYPTLSHEEWLRLRVEVEERFRCSCGCCYT